MIDITDTNISEEMEELNSRYWSRGKRVTSWKAYWTKLLISLCSRLLSSSFIVDAFAASRFPAYSLKVSLLPYPAAATLTGRLKGM